MQYLGAQLSVPVLSDCRFFAAGGVYAAASAPAHKHTITDPFGRRHSPRSNRPERDLRAELEVPRETDDD
jgi:hypothetical protein